MDTGEQVKLRFRAKDWMWSACWDELDVRASDGTASITVDGTRCRLKPSGELSRVSVEDVLGPAQETTTTLNVEGVPIQVTLRVRKYEGAPLISVQGEVLNGGDRPCALGDVELITRMSLDLGESGRGLRAYVERSPGHPTIEPLCVQQEGHDVPLEVDSQGMVTLAGKETGRAFTMGFVTGRHHRPVVRLTYVPRTDEVFLSGIARFNGRRLDPGERVRTDTLILRANADPLEALEEYGNLLAQITPPRNTPTTIGWCSWYAIRMPISHAFTMVNAQVVAERFRELGMDLMLLDHGWQTGDICGDWDPDPTDFPTGLEGLAEDLRRLGLKLGLWIAPTDTAQTARVFQEHPEWMLRDADGRPGTTWRWFWMPKPLQCQMDATQQEAYEYIVDTFRRLTKAGTTYYKIDFIAGCAREDLYPADPQYVRGWDPLRRAMEAIREGAGPSTYVRYCQTPPLLSTGWADGVFATNDTLDAGATTWPTLREVFRMSSAEYWLHGRLYNHDACDLSVRAQAGTEECRLRVTMLALSGSSILFSDDLTQLPEERIRLMQQCMPPFERAARPLNLFTSDMPDVWHLHVDHAGTSWELLALFNFGENQREVTVSWEDLSLPPEDPYLVREFWTEAFVGEHTGSATLTVPGLAVRLFSLWPVQDHPQYVGTDLHLSQGVAELSALRWEEDQGRLSGMLKRAKGLRGRVYVHVSPTWEIVEASAPICKQNSGIWAVEVSFEDVKQDWGIRAKKD